MPKGRYRGPLLLRQIASQNANWRCHPDLNRGMEALQTSALPLGHGTLSNVESLRVPNLASVGKGMCEQTAPSS